MVRHLPREPAVVRSRSASGEEHPARGRHRVQRFWRQGACEDRPHITLAEAGFRIGTRAREYIARPRPLAFICAGSATRPQP